MASKNATAVKKQQPRELTEDDILKAPEKDYMNEGQLAFFKKRLLDIRDQILRNADDTGEHLPRTRSPPIPPIAPRSRRNTRSSCARATGNASCSRRSKNLCA
jgi:hypothetical protein